VLGLPQKERELKSLRQRLEAATSHGGLLGDSLAALKKRSGELGTALAQRDVTVRQLEDELRALQAQRAQQAARHEGGRGSSSHSSSRERQLEEEVQRLVAALQQAREQAAALDCRNSELEQEAAAATAAALAAQQREQAALAEVREAEMHERQLLLISRQSAAYEQNSAGMQQQPQQQGYPEPAERSSGGPWLNKRAPAPVQDYRQLDVHLQDSQQLLRGMPQLQQAPFAPWEAQEQQGQAAAPPAAASRRGTALQQYNQPASWTPPSGRHARVAAGASDRPGSDACSVSSHAMAPAPPACSPLPLPWQLRGAMTPGQQRGSGSNGGGHGGDSSQGDAVASQFGALGLHTPSSASSPFGTEATLQVGMGG
jgi:hypothetical protein